MKRPTEADDPRRRLLIEALAAGVFAGGFANCNSLAAQILGGQPSKLPAGQSVYRIAGTATVNDKEATRETRIEAGDTVHTGRDSEIVFCVGESAMLMRADSRIVLEAPKNGATSVVLAGIKVISGKLLSVYAPGKPVQIQTVAATVQIRGTGVYVESDAEQTYFCTCYGVADISANDDPDSRETVVATHHNKPLYIVTRSNSRGKSIRSAPFIDHTDQELSLIETLVGRTPPFVFADDKYKPLRPGAYR